MKSLIFEPFTTPYIGTLKNRVSMSSMTRGFAKNHHCTDLIAEYYGKRAQDGVALIVTEGIVIHPSGDGYNNVPHMRTQSHANSWKKAVKNVQEHGSKFFCQLWHCGRISHEDYTLGEQPVSSSNKQASGINRQNNKPFAIPRPLRTEEIPQIYEQYLNSAKLAFNAGFDGVQLHMGHGYLVDQFFDSRINDRADQYGGSVENRCRFALELTELMIQEFGPEKIMIRISPSRKMGEIYDWLDLDAMLEFLIPSLDKKGLRLLDVSSAGADYYETASRIVKKIRPLWQYFLTGGTSLSIEQAEEEIVKGCLDAITWGRFILANPEFITKLKEDKPLVSFEREMLKVLV
jgi:N-ethylmaleimide reductase